MERIVNVNALGLRSLLAAAEQPTSNHNQPPTADHNAQGQTGHFNIEEELSVPMHGTMEDSQANVVYHMEADRESEAEDIHVTRQPNNAVDFDAGIQHSEFNWASSESDSEGDMQESDDGDESPMQYSNSQPQDDDVATSNSLAPANTTEGDPGTAHGRLDWAMLATNASAYDDVHDEQRGIFVDFDEEPDVDDDEARSVHEQDNQIEEEIGFGFGSIEDFVYPRTSQIISQHLSTPKQQSFTTLNDLLSSNNAPGRGLYSVEKVLEHEEGRVAELEEKIKYIEAELAEVRARRDKAYEIVRNARTTFSIALGRARIGDGLWKEYEMFCESLEPKFGNRGGWSVTCFENHNGSYVNWDPQLDLFMESAEIPLGGCNFRCEATAVERMGRTEFVVEFWPLSSVEPRTEIARTWRHQYPRLYRLAEQAANNTSPGNTLPKKLLRSLPDPILPFSGGWLFEYALEPGRAPHPTVSRRWSYRSACRIPIDGQQDQVDGTVQPESESAEIQEEEINYNESEVTESQDVKMEDDGSDSSEDQDVKMEDGE